jgi:hypothetical protein
MMPTADDEHVAHRGPDCTKRSVGMDPLSFDLLPDEQLEVVARTEPATLAITDRRLVVAAGARLVLDLPVPGLRRVQLDVERGRPATLVLVPHDPSHEPQVLAVPHGELEPVARLVAVLGKRLGELD